MPKGCYRFFWRILIGALTIVAAGDRAYAQSRELAIGEQPGVVPIRAMNSCRRHFSGKSSSIARASRQARSLSIRCTDISTSRRKIAERSVTASASAETASSGRACFASARKAEWPDWTPSPEVIKRQPQLPRFMTGGPGNPLGARVLYLGATYRIHGTNQPQTIGSAVVAGCFRLANADIIDLYARVPVGAKVVVRQRPTL